MRCTIDTDTDTDTVSTRYDALHTYPVRKCRRRLIDVELTENYRKQEENDAEQQGQPERCRRHHGRRCAHVRVAERLRVEGEDEQEIEDHATPDDEMIESRPV